MLGPIFQLPRQRTVSRELLCVAFVSTNYIRGLARHDSYLAADHINSYMHPQVVMVDSSDNESELFLEAARVQLRSMKIPLIELPSNSPSKLTWLTKLDSASLACKCGNVRMTQLKCIADMEHSMAQGQH
jgi:hypothetical protein